MARANQAEHVIVVFNDEGDVEDVWGPTTEILAKVVFPTLANEAQQKGGYAVGPRRLRRVELNV